MEDETVKESQEEIEVEVELEDAEDDEEVIKKELDEDEEEEEEEEESRPEEEDEEEEEKEDMEVEIKDDGSIGQAEAIAKESFPNLSRISALLTYSDDAAYDPESIEEELDEFQKGLAPRADGEVILDTLPAKYQVAYFLTSIDRDNEQLSASATELTSVVAQFYETRRISVEDMTEMVDRLNGVKARIMAITRSIHLKRIARKILWDEIGDAYHINGLDSNINRLGLRQGWVLVDSSKTDPEAGGPSIAQVAELISKFAKHMQVG